MSNDAIEYRCLTENEISRAINLAWKVFLKFEAPEYSKEGSKEFYDSIHNNEFISQLKLYGAFAGNVLVGTIATRSNGNHVALFFVEEDYQKHGIGSKLFKLILQDNQTGSITVNSSPYAVKVYRRLGFVPTDTEQVVNGIRYTPMRWSGGK